MKSQLKSELLKMTTARTTYWFALGTIGLALLAATTIFGYDAADYSSRLSEQQFYFVGTFSRLFLVVLGIRMVTDEYRYGTVLPTMAFAPTRGRVVAAKCLVGLGAGLVIAVLAQGALVGVASFLFGREGYGLEIGAAGLRALGGAVFAGGLWVVIGVGIGSIARNQVAAIVGSLVWLMAVEEMIRTRLGDFGDYLPGQAGFLLSLGMREKWTVIGALGLMSWAAVGSLVGSVVVKRADVT